MMSLNNLLANNLASHDYHSIKLTNVPWVHEPLSTCFMLVVDDSGI